MSTHNSSNQSQTSNNPFIAAGKNMNAQAIIDGISEDFSSLASKVKDKDQTLALTNVLSVINDSINDLATMANKEKSASNAPSKSFDFSASPSNNFSNKISGFTKDLKKAVDESFKI